MIYWKYYVNKEYVMEQTPVKRVRRHKHISSKHNPFQLRLGEVWRYRDLIWLFTKRNFKVTYKQTILGPAWLFLHPLMTSVMYAFVFGGIVNVNTEGVPQLLFYLSGTAIWTFFASTLSRNAITFTENAGVFGKVYFPRLTSPLSVSLSYAIQFLIQFIMVMGFLLYFFIQGEVSPNWWAFWIIPLVMLELGLMGTGLGIIISSLTTKYRDLSVLVSFGVTLWMYATPVVYPLSTLSDGWIKNIILLNPVTAPVELFRFALVGKGSIEPLYLAGSCGFALLVLFGGIMIFNKVERTFMDTV